jgi:hypothetical protein
MDIDGTTPACAQVQPLWQKPKATLIEAMQAAKKQIWNRFEFIGGINIPQNPLHFTQTPAQSDASEIYRSTIY